MRYGDLPKWALERKRQAQMTCSEYGPIHGVYSADYDDYFWAHDDDEIICRECGALMELGQERTVWFPTATAEEEGSE